MAFSTQLDTAELRTTDVCLLMYYLVIIGRKATLLAKGDLEGFSFVCVSNHLLAANIRLAKRPYDPVS